jgi:signal transduction histidine kinase
MKNMVNRGGTPLRNLTLIGFLTWAIIGAPSIAWELRHGTLLEPRALLWLACFLAFAVVFWLATRSGCVGRREVALIALQGVLALACSGLQPSGFQPVLLVIVAGQLGRQPLAVSITWIAVQTAVLAVIQYLSGSDVAIFLALAYMAFQLFGVFTTHVAHGEMRARQALAEANAELKVTAGLLDISSRTSERLRIARDVHDLLGHHLTALSLNLEVARHLAEGKAREQVEKSQALTKTMLADVRDIVSRLREDEPVDLTSALRSLREVITTPSLHLETPAEISVSDPAVAQVALRAVQEIVTNAVRHSGARNLWLRLAAGDDALEIEARDDGAGTDQVRFGHGLRGIRERVEQVRGTFEVASVRGHGFSVHVRLPLESAA